MFTKMLHFRWVSILGIQRVCDNQDFIETEQLKAYSRVLQTHVHVICSVKKQGQIFHGSKAHEPNRTQPWLSLVCLVYTPWWDVQGMSQKVHFFVCVREMPSISWTSKRSYLKTILTETKCPYKKQTTFVLRKYISKKKVKKDHEEDIVKKM